MFFPWKTPRRAFASPWHLPLPTPMPVREYISARFQGKNFAGIKKVSSKAQTTPKVQHNQRSQLHITGHQIDDKTFGCFENFTPIGYCCFDRNEWIIFENNAGSFLWLNCKYLLIPWQLQQSAFLEWLEASFNASSQSFATMFPAFLIDIFYF